jgi:hypothetical protein
MPAAAVIEASATKSVKASVAAPVNDAELSQLITALRQSETAFAALSSKLDALQLKDDQNTTLTEAAKYARRSDRELRRERARQEFEQLFNTVSEAVKN